jgi:hypothetical protein
MQDLCEGHWFTAKRVLKYLKGTQYFGHSDFGGDKENGVSTSSYLMSLGSSVVSWRSCKQSVPVYSTLEEKYVTVAEATMEIVWLGKILEDLQEKQVNYIPLLLDNTSAIKLAHKHPFGFKGGMLDT